MINLASPGSGDLVTRTGSPVLTATPEGPGFNCSAAAAIKEITSLNTPAQFQLANQMSAFIRGRWIGNTGSNVPDNIFGVTYNATPFWAWGIGNGAPNANNGVANAPCYFFDQGTSTFTNNYGANAALVDGSMFSAGFVGIATTGSDRLYVNGVIQHNTSGGIAFNANHYGSLSPVIVLGNTNSARTGASIITVSYIWNRLLTAGEMRYLDANPYALLRWPIDIVYDVLEQGRPASQPGGGKYFNMGFPLTVGAGAAALGERWLRRRKFMLRRGAPR